MTRSTTALFIACFVTLFISPAFPQDTVAPPVTARVFTLPEIVELARTQSPAYREAATTLNTSYWLYRTYRADYLPQLTLNGTIPDLSRSIDPITQNDGTELFRRRSLMTSEARLSLSQNIRYTGGNVFLSSSLNRIDLFEPSSITTYSANPAVIGFQQPLFQFNFLKWNYKIEPLRYEESIRQFNENMELIAGQATNLFFDILSAQVNLSIAQKNQLNTDTLYKIAQGRYELGKIAENELLQLELSLLNAGLAVTQSTLDVENSTQAMRSFLGIRNEEPIAVAEPTQIPQFVLDKAIAMDEARKNRQAPIGFKRQLLEAQRNVAEARGNTGFQASVFAEFGLTQSANLLPELYRSPLDQQRVRIGFSVPLMDWGKTRASVRTAISNQELAETTITRDELNFDQQVLLQVNQFTVIRERLRIAIKSDEIAQKRYDITKNRYVIGKIGITDLNIAQQEKDQARQAYVDALRGFWNGYYNLRLLTLYDFETQQTINHYAAVKAQVGARE